MSKKIDAQINRPIIVLGSGGHAKVLIEALHQSGLHVIGITDPIMPESSNILGVKVLGNDDVVFNYSPDEVLLVNGIGDMPGTDLRSKLNNCMEEKGFQFTTVIHPSAVIASDVVIDKGTQIMAGVVIQPGVKIGLSCIINTGTNVDHDCVINDYCHLAPGVTLSGNVAIGKRSHIGTGASIIQGVSIGENSIIAAGSIIYKDIPANTKYIQHRKYIET